MAIVQNDVPIMAPAKRRGAVMWCRWVAGLLIAGSAVACGIVLSIGLQLSAPVPSVVGAPPPDLPAETVMISSPSGATLAAWLIAGRPGGGAVALMHGLHANRLSMLRRARLMHAAGFSVLLFDFQSHGESTDNRITFGHKEGLDARAAVAYLRAQLPGERLGAVGSSLGGAAIVLGRDPLPVDAFVLEAVYPEIGAAIANRTRFVVGERIGAVVARPAAWLFQALMSPILGVRPADLRPIDRIGTVSAAILVAGGTVDDRTPVDETRAMFERARSPKRLWIVEGAGHVDLENFAPEAYRAVILPFLTEHLQTLR